MVKENTLMGFPRCPHYFNNLIRQHLFFSDGGERNSGSGSIQHQHRVHSFSLTLRMLDCILGVNGRGKNRIELEMSPFHV